MDLEELLKVHHGGYNSERDGFIEQIFINSDVVYDGFLSVLDLWEDRKHFRKIQREKGKITLVWYM